MNQTLIHILLPEEFLDSQPPCFLNEDWTKHGGSSEGAVYLTFVALREFEVSVKFTSTIPDKGILIAHKRQLPNARPTHWKNLFIICWQIDHMRCDYANCHIVSNSFMTSPAALSVYDRMLLPGHSYQLHFPTEINLKPRDPSRRDLFESISYFGAPKNLKDCFLSDSWKGSLERERMCFIIVEDHEKMGDYSNTDCVLAIRPPDQQILQKPPSKLWNAWRAGVPAILGPEPGFRDYRKSELDYIEVETPEQALAALIKLRDNPDLRQAMIENGRQRKHECSVETIIGQWVEFINGPLQKEARAWFEGPAWRRNLFGIARTARMGLRKLRHSLK